MFMKAITSVLLICCLASPVLADTTIDIRCSMVGPMRKKTASQARLQ